jgi:hypothetical protein
MGVGGRDEHGETRVTGWRGCVTRFLLLFDNGAAGGRPCKRPRHASRRGGPGAGWARVEDDSGRRSAPRAHAPTLHHPRRTGRRPGGANRGPGRGPAAARRRGARPAVGGGRTGGPISPHDRPRAAAPLLARPPPPARRAAPRGARLRGGGSVSISGLAPARPQTPQRPPKGQQARRWAPAARRLLPPAAGVWSEFQRPVAGLRRGHAALRGGRPPLAAQPRGMPSLRGRAGGHDARCRGRQRHRPARHVCFRLQPAARGTGRGRQAPQPPSSAGGAASQHRNCRAHTGSWRAPPRAHKTRGAGVHSDLSAQKTTLDRSPLPQRPARPLPA